MEPGFHTLVEELLTEGEDDWVAVDHLIAVAEEHAGVTNADFKAVSLKLLRALLEAGLMEIGDLGETGFAAWPSPIDESIERFRAGCEACNWTPMGGLWWLANTPKATEWLRSSWSREHGGNLDYLDYASQHLNLPDWVALSQCFRPHFVEDSGCVIWDRAYEPENFREWFTTLNGDATAVEATLNQFRLWQVVDVEDDDPNSERRIRKLADDIAFCWRSCLETDFPGREFDGGVVETEDGPIIRFTALRR